ncbi:ribonuclease H [Tanacetum coccineum]
MSTSKTYQQSLGREEVHPLFNNTKVARSRGFSRDDLLYYDAEMELMNMILLSIPNEIYNSVDSCKTAKEMWARVERLMRGTIQNQVDRETRFTNEFDQFVAEPGESLVSVYNRFAQLMNDLERNNMKFPTVSVNTKFLNSLQPEWLKYVTQVRLAKKLTVDSFDDLFDYLSQFEKLVNASREKKLEKSHDPLALVAHTGSSSKNTSSYYVTHPSSVVDYDEEYEQDDVHNHSEDPPTLLCLNQAVVQGDRVNIQSKNSGNVRRNNRRAYVQEEVVEGMNATNEIANVQRIVRTPTPSNTSTGQCYNCGGKGHYARNCPKPRNDFLFVDASRMEEIEELSANICLMARIQPADQNSDDEPSYESAFISEVQSSSINENDEQMYPTHTKIINSTIDDDQINSNIQFDSVKGNVNSGSVEKDTHVYDQCALETLTRNAYDEAAKQQRFAQKVQQQNMTLTSQIEMYKERNRVLENITKDNNYLKEFLEADERGKRGSKNKADSQLYHDRDIIRDLEKQRDELSQEVVFSIVLWVVDSGCSKHMTGDRSLLRNFIEKFMGIVHFGNDNFATITGYEAEYVSLSACCAQVIWMRTQLLDYGFKYNRIPKIKDSDVEIVMTPTQLEIIIMAQQQQAADVHPDELCPPNKRYDIMDANKKVDLENVQCPSESKILMNIITNHPLRFSIAASASVPWIYMAQFWHTLKEDGSKHRLKFLLDRKELTLTLDDFRTIFHLPQANDNNHASFVPPPSFSDMVPFYKQVLGFTMELKTVSNFKISGLLQPWQTLCKIFSKCLTTRVTGWDQPPLQIMQMLYCFVNNIHVDYAELMWEGIYYSLHHPATSIPYPRFTKIIISHYMTIFPDISRRARDAYHNLQDDDIMKNIFNSGRNKNKVGMRIPAWMITDEMKLTEHYKMYAEVFGLDVPLTQSQPTESTQGTHRTTSAPRQSARLTPPVPVPTAEKADEMILQDMIQVSLAEQKSREEQEARENVALVYEHLAAEEIEKLVEESENVDDSSPPRHDDTSIPGTRLEPRSDKESPEVEIVQEKEEETTKDTEVEPNIVIPVNVDDEEDEITDEVFELIKEMGEGRNVEESRMSTNSFTK